MKIKKIRRFSRETVEVIEHDGSIKTYERYGPYAWKEVHGDAAYDMHKSEEFQLEAVYQEYVGERTVIVKHGGRSVGKTLQFEAALAAQDGPHIVVGLHDTTLLSAP